MSQRTEREGVSFDTDVDLDRLRDLYHLPVLAALLLFMLWNRVRTWGNFVDGETVYFSGNDPWYHFRQTMYTVQHWPSTMPFDPWTNYPYGTATGQFGTLFDQLVATVALVVGLGNPSEHTVSMVLLFTPAVFGTLTAVPVYFIAKRLSSRAGGVIAVLILALTPGAFLRRALVGFADHNIAEVFFMTVALLAVMASLRAAREEKPVWELVTAREWDALRRPLGLAALAGVAIGLYMWTWPPGVLMVGLLAVYYFLELSVEFLKGESPEHTAMVGTVTLLVAALMAALAFDRTDLTVTGISFIQPLFSLLAALGVALMAYAGRQWENNDLDVRLYPLAFLVAGGILAAIVAVALPDLFGFLNDQVLRVFGLTANATAQTVGEAQPLSFNPGSRRYWLTILDGSYGLTFFTGLFAAVLVFVQLYLSDEAKPERLLVALWMVVFTVAIFTQVRFDYYLVVPVAVLNGYLATYIFGFVNLGAVEELGDVSLYQAITVVIVLFLVVGPFISVATAAPAAGGQGGGGTQFVFETTANADGNDPGRDIAGWDPELQWLRGNTPDPETSDFQYYGTFERTDDFDYGPQQYGVLSWWDYGHFITTRGHRIPTANPFQQGAGESANVLLTTNESEAQRYMVDSGGETTRYIMIDWQLASLDQRSEKYAAPTAFDNIGVDDGDLRFPIYSQQTGQFGLVGTQRHYESMRTRLYFNHGSAVDPATAAGSNSGIPVVDWDLFTNQNGQTFRVLPSDGQAVKRFDNMSAARAYVEQDGTAQVGGVLGVPSERVPALKHYRLVHASPNASPVTQTSYVKTFEMVDGATVEGEGPANTNITVSVRMGIPTTGETFVYEQRVRTDGQGQFTTTLPYSTTGYDEYGPENGHTNVSVRAQTQYRFAAFAENENGSVVLYADEVDVTEGQVIGEDDSPVEVTMVETDPQDLGGNSVGWAGDSTLGTPAQPAIAPPEPGIARALADTAATAR